MREMRAGASEARFLIEQNMSEGECFSFATGRVVIYSACCPGKESSNEDAAAVLPLDPERGILVVADGVGGRPGGASAAAIAVRCLRDAVGRAARADNGLRGAILDGVERANQAVRELGGGAGTTLSVAEIEGTTLRPYQVGDSATLVIGQRGKIKLRTVAHSPVGYAVESGLLDAEEAMHHDERHLISNLLGDAEMRIEVGSRLALAPRDTVLLATDGLFDNLHAKEIVETVRTKSLPVVARILAQACIERMLEPREAHPSKPDDLTFIVFRLDSAPRGA